MIEGCIENIAYRKETAGARAQSEGVNKTSATNTAATVTCLVATDGGQVSFSSNGAKMVSKVEQQEIELLIEEESAHFKTAHFHDEKMREHLLDAVRRGSKEVVVTLFEGLELKSEVQIPRGIPDPAAWNRKDFPPLILAAQLGQYDIVRFLLSKGFTIEPPHDVQCSCESCHVDYLRTSQERLSLYKALANPIWMTLTSEDPILTAFKLSMKMNELAIQEDEFEKDYNGLYKTSKQFAVGLLSECYDSKEQETILNYSHEDHGQGNGGDKRLDLLKMAISMQQKEFVAHRFSQHLLMSLIFKVSSKWRSSNLSYKILYIMIRVLVFPFMACAYIVLPCCSFSQTMKEPLIKFINHTAAFIMFLLMLTISSTQHLEIRSGHTPSGLEFFIIFCVIGLMWSECKQLWAEGLLRYLSSGWNWMDLAMLLMLCSAFIIWAITALVASMQASGYNERLQMSVSVADGFYAMGIIMSFFRLIYLCQISRYLGLLQLCLSRMVRVILQFAFISWVLLWSFSLGMHMLYTSSTNFPGKNYTLPPQHSETHAEDGGMLKLSWDGNYDSLLTSVIAMSWASLNMIELKSLSGFDNSNMIQFWSGALFTIYHASSMIVLLNMLIAMMANSYQQIEDNIEVEYKFARAQMWLEYFDDTATLPSPFNIIPTPKTISRIFSLIVEKVCGKSWSISYHGKRSFSLHRAATYNNSERKKRYLELCQLLVKRYLARQNLDELRKEADNGMIHAIESSKEEIRQTLEEMKQLMKTHKKI